MIATIETTFGTLTGVSDPRTTWATLAPSPTAIIRQPAPIAFQPRSCQRLWAAAAATRVTSRTSRTGNTR